jgi:DNA-repair protein XRCC2
MNEKGQEQLQNWIKGDESGGDMLKRVWRVRPFLLPPPLHRVPLRVGNVLELVGPSPSAKTQILIQTAITCILPKHWNGIHYGGFDHLVLFIDLDSRFDINRFSQLLIYRIIEPYGNNFFPFLFIDDFNFMLVFIAIFVYVSV